MKNHLAPNGFTSFAILSVANSHRYIHTISEQRRYLRRFLKRQYITITTAAFTDNYINLPKLNLDSMTN